MRTYRIKVDGKVYEMEISLTREEIYAPEESSTAVGERLPYRLRAEETPKHSEDKD